MTVVEMEGRTISSQHRKATAAKLPLPHDLQSTLNILGDESDEKYPIFRTPRKTDTGSTVATGNILQCIFHLFIHSFNISFFSSLLGVFDLNKQRLLVYLGNPKTNKAILDITFPWV